MNDEELTEARSWLSNSIGSVANMLSDVAVMNLVRVRYEGGLEGFQADYLGGCKS